MNQRISIGLGVIIIIILSITSTFFIWKSIEINRRASTFNSNQSLVNKGPYCFGARESGAGTGSMNTALTSEEKIIKLSSGEEAWSSRVSVGLKEEFNQFKNIKEIVERSNSCIANSLPGIGSYHIKFENPSNSAEVLESFAEELRKNPKVEYVEFEGVIYLE